MQGSSYKSKNINGRFSRAARIVAEKISGVNGVVGIIATGGIGRGFSDENSDLDLFVFPEEKQAADERERLLKFCHLVGMGLEDVTMPEIIAQNTQNWENASAKTKKSLSF